MAGMSILLNIDTVLDRGTFTQVKVKFGGSAILIRKRYPGTRHFD